MSNSHVQLKFMLLKCMLYNVSDLFAIQINSIYLEYS